MKALIVSADMFEDLELLIPYYRLLEEKIETDIASIKAGTIIGKHGYQGCCRTFSEPDRSVFI